MAKPALGRDLGDLLSQARPARIVATPGSPPADGEPGVNPSLVPASEPSPRAVGSSGVDAREGVPAGAAHPAPAESFVSPSSPAGPAAPVNPGAPGGPGASGAPASRPAAWDGTRPRYRPNRPASTPSSPGPARRPALFYWLLAGDVVLLIVVAVLVFGGWMGRPWARATALGALVFGGAMSALAVSLPRRETPGGGATESRVRVHLTRV